MVLFSPFGTKLVKKKINSLERFTNGLTRPLESDIIDTLFFGEQCHVFDTVSHVPLSGVRCIQLWCVSFVVGDFAVHHCFDLERL